MAKAWGSVGTWAADSEPAENNLTLQHSQQQPPLPLPSLQPELDDTAFPSLVESASAKTKKKKKKQQQQTFTLAEFTVGKDVGPGGKSRSLLSSDSKGLTADEMLVLPTGPRDRSGEEDSSGGIGGAFKDYGAYRGRREGGDRDKDRSFTGGFGDQYDRKERAEEPSRADDSDDWGALKKSAPPSRGAYEDDRRRGDRMSNRDLASKADADDNWASNKRVTLLATNGRSSGRYEDLRSSSGRYEDPRGGGFNDSNHSSRADDVNDWGAAKKSVPSLPNAQRSGSIDFSQRDKDVASDPNRWGGMERPRLVLQPRTRPLDSSPSPVSGSETENTRPFDGSVQDPVSSNNKAIPFGDTRSREQVPASKGQNMECQAPKPLKLNPFGEAKPREILLEQKGMDWRKLDANLERNSLQRPETEEEKELRDEIKLLQEILKSGDLKLETKCNVLPKQNSNLNVTEELAKKERDLEQLTSALNDKVRFSQVERGSRTGNVKGQDIWTRSVSREHDKREGSRW